MIKAMRISNTVVCTINQKMYKKTCSTTEEILELYDLALNTDETNEEELSVLLAMFAPKKTKEEEKQEEERKKLEEEVEKEKSLIDWLKEIEENGDEHFELVGMKLYMKGINITVPQFLATEFAKRRNNQEDLSAMMNFWRLLALNPDPRCREDLYSFLIKNDLSLTPSGYFVTYRNVNIKNKGLNEETETFILESWLKVKKWKKNVKNYVVVRNAEKDLLELMTQEKFDNVNQEYYTKNEIVDYDYEYDEYGENEIPIYDDVDYLKYEAIGTLDDLHAELISNKEEGTVYTDAHTGTFSIRIGELVSIDRKDCDADPERLCSFGLHSGNLNFMNTQGYSFGKVGIICLINPMDVVAVPTSYDGKMRSSAYLPIALTEYDNEGKIIPVDTTTFEYDYAKHTQEELEKMINIAKFESLKEHDIIPKEISLTALKTVVSNLKTSWDEMRDVIQNRVKTV
jgi:hypothetical protein